MGVARLTPCPPKQLARQLLVVAVDHQARLGGVAEFDQRNGEGHAPNRARTLENDIHVSNVGESKPLGLNELVQRFDTEGSGVGGDVAAALSIGSAAVGLDVEVQNRGQSSETNAHFLIACEVGIQRILRAINHVNGGRGEVAPGLDHGGVPIGVRGEESVAGILGVGVASGTVRRVREKRTCWCPGCRPSCCRSECSRAFCQP
jgi:hypothetical protein